MRKSINIKDIENTDLVMNSVELAQFFLANDSDISFMAFMLDMLTDELAESELLHFI